MRAAVREMRSAVSEALEELGGKIVTNDNAAFLKCKSHAGEPLTGDQQRALRSLEGSSESREAEANAGAADASDGEEAEADEAEAGASAGEGAAVAEMGEDGGVAEEEHAYVCCAPPVIIEGPK